MFVTCRQKIIVIVNISEYYGRDLVTWCNVCNIELTNVKSSKYLESDQTAVRDEESDHVTRWTLHNSSFQVTWIFYKFKIWHII